MKDCDQDFQSTFKKLDLRSSQNQKKIKEINQLTICLRESWSESDGSESAAVKKILSHLKSCSK